MIERLAIERCCDDVVFMLEDVLRRYYIVYRLCVLNRCVERVYRVGVSSGCDERVIIRESTVITYLLVRR